jgi:hypothetical protein
MKNLGPSQPEENSKEHLSILLIYISDHQLEGTLAGHYNGSSRNKVCSTDLQLDTSTNGLKQVYTCPQAIY